MNEKCKTTLGVDKKTKEQMFAVWAFKNNEDYMSYWKAANILNQIHLDTVSVIYAHRANLT